MRRTPVPPPAIVAAVLVTVLSGCSREIPSGLPDRLIPSSPQGLVGRQLGGVVELIWQPSSDDVAVTGYLLARDGQAAATVGDTVYVDDAVSVGETHRYWVAALDAAGNRSGPSAEVVVTVMDVTPPTVPQGLLVEQLGAAVALVWDASSDDVGVAGYTIFRDGSPLVTVGSPGYVDTSAAASATYTYFVVAVDAAGNDSGPSEERTVAVADVTAPSAPLGLVAEQVGTIVELDWQAASDDVGVVDYRVSRDGAEVETTTGTSYVDESVEVEITYRYVVTAVDAAGNESEPSAEADVTVLDVTPPSAPPQLTGEQVGTAVELAWEASSDDVAVTAYRVLRDEADIASVTEASHVDGTVAVGTTYRYMVVAVDAAGNQSEPSAEVTVPVEDVTPPSEPEGLTAVQVGTGVELEWEASSDDAGVTSYRILRDGSKIASVAGTGHVDASASVGPHRYVVVAMDAAGNASGPSAEVALTVQDVTPPSAPPGLTAEQVGPTVELTWQPAADDVGVSVYRILRDGSEIASVGGTSYVDASAGLGPHEYVVVAVDAPGNQGVPSTEAGVTVQDVTPPSVPQGLDAEQVGTTVELDWQASSDDVGVTSYRVRRNGSQIASVSGTGYVDGAVSAGTTYRYVVVALDAAGNASGPSSEVVMTAEDVTPPSVPQGLTAEQVGMTVELDWQASSDDVGVTSYRVRRNGSQIASVSGTSRVDANVVVETTYSYVVVAVDAAGNQSGPSDVVSMTVRDVTAPSVPQGLAAEQVGTTVELDWQASNDDVAVTSYRVRRNGSVIATVGGTAYTDGSVAVGSTYTYRVSARDAADNESAQSAPVSITVQPVGGSMAFSNITNATTGGPSAFGGHAISFADVTGDGLPDFYVTIHRNNLLVDDLFYRNLGGGAFTEEAASRGINDLDFGSHGAVWADLDDDGDYDLYNGGTGDVSASGSASDVNNVYRQNGNGSFTDITPADDPGGATRGVLALDMERDGDLDLFAVNGWQGQLDDQPTEQFNEIYRNNSGSGFTYLPNGAFQSAPAGQGATGSDFDGDGDVDVFASNQGALNVLENVGGTFVQRSAALLGISSAHQARDGVTTADVNNDGHVDLLLAGNDYGHLYLNDGDGTFTHRQSFTSTQGYMGGFGDLDQDGDLDLVFAGDNRVFVNDGSGSFPSSVSVPIGPVNDPRSIAFADIDDDGDLDFFVTQKFATNRLIRNDYSGGNRWLKVRLTSPRGQAGAFGATVRAYAAGTNDLLAFREARGAYGYVAQDEPVLHLGLGGASRVDLVVRFLNGSEVHLDNVQTNRLVSVGP
jgi:fibronectin type 3 domain-containing protein